MLHRDDRRVRRHLGEGNLPRQEQADRAAGDDDLLPGVPDELHGHDAGGLAAGGGGRGGRRLTCASCRPPTSAPRSAMSLDRVPADPVLRHQAQGRRHVRRRDVHRAVPCPEHDRQDPAGAGQPAAAPDRRSGAPGFAGAATVRQHVRRRADLHPDRLHDARRRPDQRA